MWDYGTQSPKYFSLAIGITVTPAYFSLLIAQGVTRRMFSVAAGIYLAGAAAATALLWVLVYQVEHALYASAGLARRTDQPAPVHEHVAGRSDVRRVLPADRRPRGAGWLLGITFVRFGVWRGILLLPLALVPAAAAEFLLVAQWLADVLDNIGYHRPPLAVAAPSVLVVSVLGVYGGYRLLHPLAVKPPKG